MTGTPKTNISNNRGRNNGGRHHSSKPAPIAPQEAVPVLHYGPTNNWTDFSKKMRLAVGDRFGKLSQVIENKTYYIPPMPTPDENIKDSKCRDIVLETDWKERAKELAKLNSQKPMLYAFILSKLSVESEDEYKRHDNYKAINDAEDPLELRKACSTWLRPFRRMRRLSCNKQSRTT